MKAIKTEYFGPTNYRGSRIIASDGDNNKIIHNWNYNLDIEENHYLAMQKLCLKMKWDVCDSKGWYKDSYYWIWSKK